MRRVAQIKQNAVGDQQAKTEKIDRRPKLGCAFCAVGALAGAAMYGIAQLNYSKPRGPLIVPWPVSVVPPVLLLLLLPAGLWLLLAPPKHLAPPRSRARRGVRVLLALAVTLLAALYTQRFQLGELGTSDQSRRLVDLTRDQFKGLSGLLREFEGDCGRLPTAAEGLDALVRRPPSLIGRWNGPYADSSTQLLDPWGRSIRYAPNTSQPGSFTLSSAGESGVVGGSTSIVDRFSPRGD